MFSVIVPLYNKENDVLLTIESVLKQSFPNFELIIVNDDSKDKSLEIVKKVTDSRIKIFTKPNGGVSSARNFGIKQAKFEYIALLDADDLWEREYLMSVKNSIISNSNNHVFATNYRIRLSYDRYYIPKFALINTKSSILIIDDYFAYSKHDSILTASSVIMHKSVFDKIGYFDTNLSHGEDLDFWFRISEYFKIVFINQFLMTYRYDSSNRSISILPNFNNIFISKYELNGNKSHDYYLSKSAYRFSVLYLLCI
jgi:glycosyltransferase involved in cell wall biosynthesis